MYHGRRYVGGWRWVELVKAWAKAIAAKCRPIPETRRAIVERRQAIAQVRVRRWLRAHLRNGRPTRRIPRHIKQMMREASPRSRWRVHHRGERRWTHT